MALYADSQRVWCRSQQSLGIIREANYTPKAVYVVEFVSRDKKFIDGEWQHVPTGHDFMTGSKDLRAADWSCDSCDGWFPGRPYRTAPDGEYPNGLQFCFLCVKKGRA